MDENQVIGLIFSIYGFIFLLFVGFVLIMGWAIEQGISKFKDKEYFLVGALFVFLLMPYLFVDLLIWKIVAAPFRFFSNSSAPEQRAPVQKSGTVGPHGSDLTSMYLSSSEKQVPIVGAPYSAAEKHLEPPSWLKAPTRY